AAPGTKSIWNSTCRVGGNPSKSSGKTSGKSHTVGTSSSRFSSDLKWKNETTNPSLRLGEGLYSTWIGRPMGYDGLPMGLVSETIPKLPEVVGKGKAKESSSTTDSERTESGTDASAPKVEKEQGEVTSSIVSSGVVIPVQTEDQAGSDAEKAHEALAGPDPEPMQKDQPGSDSRKEHVSLAGPNPEHMDEDFYATAYPKIHENLKLKPDEHVIEENPESHSRSMSSMKNLEDTVTYGDLFLNDKPTEDDPRGN
ncbi:hypothetical protein Tco_0481201, partial [Tanacetum coccineum]